MSEPTTIFSEGLLKGNVDIEDGPQQELRAILTMKAMLHQIAPFNIATLPPAMEDSTF